MINHHSGKYTYLLHKNLNIFQTTPQLAIHTVQVGNSLFGLSLMENRDDFIRHAQGWMEMLKLRDFWSRPRTDISLLRLMGGVEGVWTRVSAWICGLVVLNMPKDQDLVSWQGY